MSVKNFKFVSPGVFINEIDKSFRPKQAENIGPVIVGRARRGPAWVPTRVESYSQFVEIYGEAVPGNGGTDVYRDGNLVSPMYGTYAAKAFLRSNVAPLTYIRVLGEEHTSATTAGKAGWQTTNPIGKDNATGKATPGVPGIGPNAGGAYGMFLFRSGSAQVRCAAPHVVTPGRISGNVYPDTYAISQGQGNNGDTPGTPDALAPAAMDEGGVLAAIFYMNSGSVSLSGTIAGNGAGTNTTFKANAPAYDGMKAGVGVNGVIVGSATGTNLFTAHVTDSDGTVTKVQFNFDPDSPDFIRTKFNTNPQMIKDSATQFYPRLEPVWLGETFEQTLLNWNISGSSIVGQEAQAVIMQIQEKGSTTRSAAAMRAASQKAKAGWFIAQDQGPATAYKPQDSQKLFRLKALGGGEWLHKNVKVSIERIQPSPALGGGYGSFSVVFRSLHDTDSAKQVMERFDNCNLDPTSPNFVARKIGNKFTQWDDTSKTLRTYGEYNTNSKFVYVEMDADVEAGATSAELLPVGYFGPPRWKSAVSGNAATIDTATNMGFIGLSGSTAQVPRAQIHDHEVGGADGHFISASFPYAFEQGLTASLYFPTDLLVRSASDAGLQDPRDANFGFMSNRTHGSSRAAQGLGDLHRYLYSDMPDDPTSAGELNPVVGSAYPYDAYGYVFSLDDVQVSSTSNYYYESGSRQRNVSLTATGSLNDLLLRGYNGFTAPFWGGFDGFDITKPDPLYNKGMVDGTSTEKNNYIYNTWGRAIDSLTDPEQLDMNVLAAPGLTLPSLTKRMIDVCQDRADSLAVIDLPDVYTPMHEEFKTSKPLRITSTPKQAVDALKNRRIDSSYGCTFYPWVQTRDDETGQLLWIPPSVAMLGVFGSSESRSDVWFAPAGFNRGGLSDGAAGIPITGITEKLTSRQRDQLYDGKVNPIASFPSTGIVVFGQKTLQERQSALDRINVRRLVIFMKKQIAILSTQVLFEQNVQATWNRFKGLVEPFLATVKTRFGITDYRLILDETTTTPDLIDQNVMYAKIMIKPARAIEYIAIDFVILSTGASFDD